MTVRVVCAQCASTFSRPAGEVNRAARRGAPLYCNRACAGLARRVDRTAEEKRAAKAEYDRKRRELLWDVLAAAKREAYFANPNRLADGAAMRRAKRETIRTQARARNQRPENRAKKHVYDIERARAAWGAWGDAWRLLLELEREIRRRVPDKYERQKARGYIDRQIERQRERRRARREAA